MAGKFDPLHTWLGIPPAEQPPNYYRVFGLKLFESDQAAITAASNRVIKTLQSQAEGPQAEYAKKLLPNVNAIRKCLLDPQARAAYDAKLRAKTAGQPEGPQRKPASSGETPKPASEPQESPQRKPGSAGDGPKREPRTGKPASSGQPAAARASASLTRAKPLAAPPPPPPPPAPVPPPMTEVASPAAEAVAPPAPPQEAAAEGWAGEFQPEPYEARSSTDKRSKRGRGTGKKAAAAEDQADGNDAGKAKAGKAKGGKAKGGSKLKGVLVALGVLVLLGGLGGGGYYAYTLLGGSKTPKPLAQATPKPKAADAPEETMQEEPAADKPAKEPATDAAEAPAEPATDAAQKLATKGKPGLGRVGAAPPLDENATAVDPADEPLLQLARDGGPIDKVKELLAGGANIETADAGGRSLFRLAVMGGHTDLVDALLDKNVKVDTVDVLGQTPLMSAAQRGDAAMVEKLLGVGADPNIQSKVATLDDSGGLTALLVAVRQNKPDIVKLLIDNKADINKASGRGVTPLMLACWQANAAIVQMLIVREPQVGATDDQGQTALMYAVEGGDEGIVKQVLFNNEARVYVKSVEGATPLGIALAKKLPGVVAMLREAAKKESPPLDF